MSDKYTTDRVVSVWPRVWQMDVVLTRQQCWCTMYSVTVYLTRITWYLISAILVMHLAKLSLSTTWGSPQPKLPTTVILFRSVHTLEATLARRGNEREYYIWQTMTHDSVALEARPVRCTGLCSMRTSALGLSWWSVWSTILPPNGLTSSKWP